MQIITGRVTDFNYHTVRSAVAFWLGRVYWLG